MKGLPNVLDLPLISGFVQSSIKAAASAYVRLDLFGSSGLYAEYRDE